MREVVGRIDAAWKDWLEAIDRVDPARREEQGVCGYWSVKDLVAHLTLWDRVLIEHIERWEFGLADYDFEVDVLNQAHYLTTHDREYDLLRFEMHAAHNQARLAVHAIGREPDDELLEHIGGETWNHYPQHTRQVVDWLEGTGAR